MKKFYAILCLTITSLTQLQAQAPQGFNYQATVRNSSGDLIVNTNVYFKFNVMQGSQTSLPVFTEIHYVPTDDLGQVNLVIGQGTPTTGIFSALDWSLGSFYLGIELDTGNGYVAMGTTQLLSVPYALYAENSGNSTPTTPNLQSVLAENNSANNQQIKDLQDPTEAQDAVTFSVLLEKITELQNQLDYLGDLENWSDSDGDGFTELAGDCNDSDASVRPGIYEVSDGIDNNCDGNIDEGYNEFDDVIDIDGNNYNFAIYGDQVWTVDNAEMVTYRDGTPIPQVTDPNEWVNLTTGAWAYYDNDPTKGKLYNWYAVMGIHDTDPNTPNKEFAPEGWHVPTDAEWTTLENYLIANGYNYDQTTTENKIAKAMASTTGWNSSTQLGAPGNDQSLNNSSGFNAFPEGYRISDGSFISAGELAIFWSSTESSSDSAWVRYLAGNVSNLGGYDGSSWQDGFSVRFVRDSEVNSNAQVNPIYDVYVCSGDSVYPVDFSTTNTQGTTQYYWTNDNDSTGIPLSGQGNQFFQGVVSNTTSEPQVSTITVTPELTFQGQTTTGPPETFTVTVNPWGQVNQVADITVNSGETTQPIVFSTSNTSGTTTYTWIVDNTSIGVSSSGIGDVPAFTAINTTTAPIVCIISVTTVFTNGGISCQGPSMSFTITVYPTQGSITDIEGNQYDYLTYGTQQWTVKNAEMVTYRDGTPIPQVTDDNEWLNLTTGAWCYYDNDPTKPRLYNWYAVMGIHDTDPNTPNKEFSPEGWHVPTHSEWYILENYLIANGYNYDGTTTGDKIAKAMASTTGWNFSGITGTPGYDQSLNNSSGFNAFPGSTRYSSNGLFSSEGNFAQFWSSTESNGDNALGRTLSYYSSTLGVNHADRQYGFSVRFVRD